MNSQNILLRSLGVAHVLVAVLLLPASTFLGILFMPLAVSGLIWLVILGFRLWSPDHDARRALRITHLALAPLAVLLVAYGLYCVRATRRSAEGGLFDAFAYLPIGMGLAAAGLAFVSLLVSYASAIEKTPGGGRQQENDPVEPSRGQGV